LRKRLIFRYTAPSYRSLEVTVPDRPTDNNSSAALPPTMRLISGSTGSDVEIHHGETFNLVEEVYVVEDSKSEARLVEQELALDGNNASKNHLLSIAAEIVSDTKNLPSPRSLSATEQQTKHIPSTFSNAGTLPDSPLNISDMSAGNICDDPQMPRNLSPVSEESAGDNSTANIDPAAATYVSYSTPSLDDVTMVEAMPERHVKPDVTDLMAGGSRTELDLSRNVTNNTTGLPHPLQYQHFVVVAIDIGTTYSGYAFCFTRDPDSNIHMMRKWEGMVFNTIYIILNSY
jgi:hypothetical protein